MILVRLIERVTTAFGYVAALLLVPLVLATCYEVVARYVFGAPTIWAYELAYMCTGSLFLLGLAYTLQQRGHIRIDLVYAQLNPRGQAFVDLAGYVLLLLPFVACLSLYLWTYMADAYEMGERSGQSAWNPVIWPFRLAFFAGFGLLGLQVIAEIIKAAAVVTGRRSD